MDKCYCGKGNLLELAKTPWNWCSDLYQDTHRTIFYECNSGGCLMKREQSENREFTGNYQHVGKRLTKNDIQKNAKKGIEWVELARLDQIIGEYNGAKKNGTFDQALEESLLKEWGWNDDNIKNVRWSIQNNPRMGKSYSDVMEYAIDVDYQLKKNRCNRLVGARKRLNKMLGSDLY